MMMGLMTLKKALVLAVLMWAAPALSQTVTPVPPVEPASTRFPADGLAVLDCAPALPAPVDSCILRVPPSRKLESIEKSGVSGEFGIEHDIGKDGSGLQLSDTMVLIDLTPGLRGERKPSWAKERALILSFVRSLPDRQPIALYGFNESLVRLTDFTTDRALLEKTVQTLDLRGSNTRIATNALDAINVLAAQKSTILHNLIIFSDGEEEGTRALTEVAAAAVKQGVTVSTFGLFWRPVGAPANGAGLDYLQALSEGALGATGGVNLARPAEATAGIAAFVTAVNGAINASGLILPRGTAVETDISVKLSKPRAGEAGLFDEETAIAHFTPAAVRDAKAKPVAPEPKPPAAEQPIAAPAAAVPPLAWYQADWNGYPMLWWLIGGAVLVLLLLLVMILLLRRGGGSARDDDMLPPVADAMAYAAALPAMPKPAAPKLPALAYLVRSDTGERLAVCKPRVTIGRSESCDVIVEDASVSRLHAELDRRDPNSYALTDSGSLNKTKVNGKALSGTRLLKPGDTVTFGDINLRFSLA